MSVAVVAGGFVGPIVLADAAFAASFTVNSFNDRPDNNLADNICRTSSGSCSLRAAIQQANATPGTDEIRLSGGTYRLGRVDGVEQPASIDTDNSRDLDVSSSLSIVGATGATRSVIDGGRYARILEIHAGNPNVNVSNVTLTNGGESETPRFGVGGAMLIRTGWVSLHRVTVRDNVTTLQGSGIANAGTLTLSESTVDNNRNLSTLGGGGVTATGGGIFNYSTGWLTIDRSTISNNFSLRGGGLNNSAGNVTITNSTISGNSAMNSGGAIRNQGNSTGAQGILNIAFSTIVGNQANMPGGADAQRVGGGIANVGGQVNMGGTILAANTDNRSTSDRTPDCHSPETFRFTSFRNNVIGLINGPCDVQDTIWGTQLFDRVSRNVNAPLDPRVGALAANGGPTMTRQLFGGSPAMDWASSGTSSTLFNCPATDQRATSRPRDGDFNGSAICDAGSFEIG
ncbi:MAG TPA: CSLREA domain-containing protein [Pilimelia sp.]|nr:CSLREA domain-containing protein [Pilimelia sp.]